MYASPFDPAASGRFGNLAELARAARDRSMAAVARLRGVELAVGAGSASFGRLVHDDTRANRMERIASELVMGLGGAVFLGTWMWMITSYVLDILDHGPVLLRLVLGAALALCIAMAAMTALVALFPVAHRLVKGYGFDLERLVRRGWGKVLVAAEDGIHEIGDGTDRRIRYEAVDEVHLVEQGHGLATIRLVSAGVALARLDGIDLADAVRLRDSITRRREG